MSKTLCLIAACPKTPLERHENQVFVSLTPEVSYELSVARLPYRILADFNDQRQLRSFEQAYFKKQLKWWADVDAWLESKYQHLYPDAYPFQPFRYHFSRLKYFFDTLVLNIKFIERLLEFEKPDHIVVFPANQQPLAFAKTINNFRYYSQTFFWEILFDLYQKGKITVPLQGVVPAVASKAKPPQATTTLQNPLFQDALRHPIKWGCHFFRYKKWAQLIPKKKSLQGLRLLFLDAGNDTIDHLMFEALHRGAKVYLREKKNIFDLGSIFEKTLYAPQSFDLSIETLSKGAGNNLSIYQEFENSSHLNFFDDACGHDVRDIVRPYLSEFINQVCPDFFEKSSKLTRFIKKMQFDFVVARSAAGTESAKVLTAAKRAQVPTVCFEHGYSLLDWDCRAMTELDLFDHYFAAEMNTQSYFKRVTQHHPACQIHLYSNPLLKIRDQIHSSKRMFQKSSAKPVLIYPVKRFPQNRLRMNDHTCYLTWYFELQKAVLDLLAVRRDYQVIYKQAVTEKWAEGSSLRYISDFHAQHISVSCQPFVETLPLADRVLFDYPSSAFHEAAASGIPVFCLYPDFKQLTDEAKMQYRRCLQPFSDIPDAIQKIATFLDQPAQEYQLTLPLKMKSALDTLFELKNKSNSPFKSNSI